MTPPSLTLALAELAASVTLDDAPADCVETMKAAILDCLACAAAGSVEPPGALAASYVRDMGGSPESTVIGFGFRAPAALAALVNGAAAHALDFDDVSPTMIHPSVTLVPAVLAVGEQTGADGRALLEAYLAGFEVETRLCRVMNPEHYAAGWHSTATIGPLGAAVAAGRLLGLDVDGFRRALALAASRAGGLRQNFGSMVKPLHAGQAAHDGTVSAQLARRGYTADLDILDGPRGYLAVFQARQADPAEVLAVFREEGLELSRSGIGLKRYACCGAIHTSLDALGELQAAHGFRAEDIERIECGRNAMAPDILIHSRADTPHQGMFCQEYCLAAYAFDGALGLAQLTPERVADPAVRDLMGRVRTYVDPDIPFRTGRFAANLAVHLRDGTVHTARAEDPKGYPEDPLGWEELVAKARDCCARALPDQATEELIGVIRGMPESGDAAAIGGLVLGAG